MLKKNRFKKPTDTLPSSDKMGGATFFENFFARFPCASSSSVTNPINGNIFKFISTLLFFNKTENIIYFSYLSCPF